LIDDDGSWLLIASEYLHLNPVRTRGMGLGKADEKAESRGFREPSKEVKNRLEKLRDYAWRSCPAYAGYATKLKWLHMQVILGSMGV